MKYLSEKKPILEKFGLVSNNVKNWFYIKVYGEMQNFQSAEKNKLELTKTKSKKSLKNKRKWMANNS